MRLNDLVSEHALRQCVTGSAILVAASALAACGGSKKSGNSDTTVTAMPANSAAAGSMSPTTPAGTSAAGAAATVTGKMTDVKMVGDAKGYRFEPANFTVKIGDGARFTNVSGGPHDVTFWSDSIPAGVATQLNANMPNVMAPLTGPLLTTPNETYTVSFAGLKPGVYHYYCTPHLALGMTGTITVQ